MLTSTQVIMLAVVAVISAFGGFVQWIRKEDAIRTSTELVKTVSTGVFTGILSFVALTTIEMDSMLRYVLSGLASYIGGSLLDMSAQVATKVAERKLGISSGQTDETTNDHLDNLANLALQSGKKAPAPQPIPAPIPAGDVPVQVRPGEVLLEAYQAEADQQAQQQLPAPEKPKRKRAPRKKKVEETPLVVATTPDQQPPALVGGTPATQPEVPQQ